jgi:hypothetical protein
MGVSLSDLIALAKAGYTPANVKELISLSETVETQKTEKPKEDAPAPTTPKSADPEPEETKAPEKEPEDKPEETVDYKALYEKSQADLRAAQEANRSSSQPEDKSADLEKHLAETFASFM